MANLCVEWRVRNRRGEMSGVGRLAILRIGKSGVKAEAVIEYGYLNILGLNTIYT